MCIFMQPDRRAELVNSLGSLNIYSVSTGLQRDWQTRFLTCHLNWQLENYFRVVLLSLSSFTRQKLCRIMSVHPGRIQVLDRGCQRHGKPQIHINICSTNGCPQLTDRRQSFYPLTPFSSSSAFYLVPQVHITTL